MRAQNLYYNPAASSGASWFAANQWNDTSFSDPFDQSWADGNIANFNFSTIKIVSLSGTSVNVGGIVNQGGVNNVWIGSSSAATVNFSGGTISGGSVDFISGANLAGTVVKTASIFTMTAGTGVFTGTFTNQAGTSYFRPGALSASSNFIVTGDTLAFQDGDTYANAGNFTVNGGAVSIGRFSGSAVSVSMNSLQGSGGTIQSRLGSTSAIQSLIVNQSTNTAYAGSIAGVQVFSATTYLAFTKSGSGTLTLNGSTVNLRQGTTVSEGTLLLNGGGTRNFENFSGSNAITVVAGGALGGTSVVSVFGGDSVLVEDGGSLAAGNGVGGVGRTSLSFNAGGSLNLSGVTTGTNWLKFDIGATTTAGTTYDQIRVTDGTLNIGSGLLNFNDFAFNAISGIEVGAYTLFDVTGSGTLSGSLGGSLSGGVGGYFGTLSQSGNNIVLNLTAIPEPGSGLLGLIGLGLMVCFRRRR